MSNIRRNLFWVLDLSGMLGAFLATHWIAPFVHARLLATGVLLDQGFDPLSHYLWVYALIAPAAVMSVEILGGYSAIPELRPARILVAGALGPVAGMALLSTMFFLLKTPGYSRIFVVSFASASAVVLCGFRFLGHAWYESMAREGLYTEQVALVGNPNGLKLAAESFRAHWPPSGRTLVGYFSLDGAASALVLKEGLELPFLGEVKELASALIHQAIERVVMVLPASGSGWLETALRTCAEVKVTVQIIPEALLLIREGDPTGVPSLTVIPSETLSEWLFVKRVMDVCLSAALLVLLAPVFLAIAAAIKTMTPDLKVFYPWRVVGYRGRRFTGYKFTTMDADADARRAELAPLNEMSGPVFKIAKDPRVTLLGRFLRKYSLNELPQLWSVLKGDMSLVGPRPAGPNELLRYELWHKRKLSAQPGITCLWQVNGRNRISNFDEWVRLDLEYIEKRSFWVDCKILAKTAWVVLQGTGC